MRFLLVMTWVIFSAVALSGVLTADELYLLVGAEGTSEGSASQGKLFEPFAAEYDEDGVLWIVEMQLGNRLLKVEKDGTMKHVAGVQGARDAKKEETAIDGEALAAKFYGPHNLAIAGQGNVLLADTWNGVVRSYDDATKQVSTMTGYRVAATQARNSGPYCITLSFDKKRLYIADLQRVWCRDMTSGEVRVVAGNGKKGIPVDQGVAVQEPLVDPRAVAEDRQGNVYVLERGGNALRVVDREGRIRTVVNRTGAKGHSGDGGEATLATLNGPKHLCIDLDDSVIIADAENQVIRRFDPKSGLISRIAGTGTQGKGKLPGRPLECDLARPHGVSVDSRTGDLIITDSYNDRILRLDRDISLE